MSIVRTVSGNGSPSIQIDSGSDRMVIAVMSQSRNPPTIGSVTFNGVAMTVLPYQDDGGINAASVAYILDADLPSSGTYSIASGSSSSRVTLIYCEDMQQIGPVDTGINVDVLTGSQSGDDTKYIGLSSANVGDVCVLGAIGGTINGVYDGCTRGIDDAPRQTVWTETQTDVGLVTDANVAFAAAAFAVNTATGPTITDIDGDNIVNAGQTNATITGEFGTVSAVTLGGEALTVNSSTATTINVDIPVDTLKWDELYQLAVTDETGTGTLDDVSLLTRVGWEYVTYDGTVLDPATTESFAEKVSDDFGFSLVAGDRVQIESHPNITELRTDTTFVVDPPISIVGQEYSVWREVQGLHSVVSTFTINDLGEFVGAAVLTNPQAGNQAKVDTDTDSGIMYCWATTNSSELAEDIIANGTSKVVTSVGTVTISPSGRLEGQTYYNHFVQVTGENSNVVSSASYLFELSNIPPEYRWSVGKVGQYLIENGLVVAINVNDAVVEWLIGEGIPSGNINDMMFLYLEGLGYEGATNTKYYLWRKDP